jgi:hypothetical protein
MIVIKQIGRERDSGVENSGLWRALPGKSLAPHLSLENTPATTRARVATVEHVVPAAALDHAVEDWIGRLLTSAPRAVPMAASVKRGDTSQLNV